MEITINDALNKGIEAHKAGKIQEADCYYTAILKVQPKHADANHNLGVIALSIGNGKQALSLFKTALEADPSVAQFWFSYIDALIKSGKTHDAVNVLNQAKAKGAEGVSFTQLEKQLNGLNLENVKEPTQEALQPIINLYNQGLFQQVLEQATDLLEQFSRSINLYNIKGAANSGLKRFDEAIDSYMQALKIKPDYAEAYNNMGIAQKEKGDLEAAIASYKQALRIKPDYDEAYYNMGNALKGVIFSKPNSDFDEILASLLDKKTIVRPKDISNAAISLIKFNPVIQNVVKLNSEKKLDQSLSKNIVSLSSVPLLLKLMSVCPINDLELEAILTAIRSAVLLSISKIGDSFENLRFQSALALQCFTNEYIYNQSDEETKAFAVLEKTIEKKLLKGQQPCSTEILCLASYKALYEYRWCYKLSFPKALDEISKRLIREPQEEKRLKSEFPKLREITDTISSKVRDQYEENPYPRWVNLGLPLKPVSVNKTVTQLGLKLCDNTISQIESPEILVAGCGTGQQSIGTAARFRNSNVLAIDLSLASLAYAKRRTQELGIENTDYIQADILDLGRLGRQFDIIESTGVLHHMDNPMDGWKVLTDCLKPGGLMKIGLYSELARQHIIKVREEIRKKNIGNSVGAIRSFRNSLINSDKLHHRKIISSSDFYSFSTMRDLLFHVQEHCFTLPQIKNGLAELGLEFCGFENDRIVKTFMLKYQEIFSPYDLNKWNDFEQENPNTFAGMYLFWCQKTI